MIKKQTQRLHNEGETFFDHWSGNYFLYKIFEP